MKRRLFHQAFFCLILPIIIGSQAAYGNAFFIKNHVAPHLHSADSLGDELSEIKRGRLLYQQAIVLFEDPLQSATTIQLLTQARKLLLRYGVSDSVITDICMKLGTCYKDLGKNYEALEELRNAKLFNSKIRFTPDFFSLYISLGDLFVKIYDYDSAEYYYTFLEHNLSRFSALDVNEHFHLYNAMGILYYHYGDQQLALNYYEKSLETGLRIYPQEHEYIVRIRSNIASSLLALGRFKESIQKYRSLLVYNKSLATIYQNMGKAYQGLNQFDSSLIYLKKAEPIADENVKVKLFNNLGITYAGLKEYDNALAYIGKAIDHNTKVYRTKNGALAYSYMNRGNIYEAKGQIDRALEEYQTALTMLKVDFDDKDIYRNPKDVNNLVSALYLFECLKNKAGALRKHYQETLKIGDLEAAIGTYELAVALVDNIRKSYSSERTKLFFSNTVHPIYEEAITVAFELYKVTKHDRYRDVSFAFSEKAKMAVLSEVLGDLKFKQLPGISAELIRQERKLKQSLSKSLTKLAELGDSIQIRKIKKDIIDQEIALSNIVKQLEKNKNYHDLKYNYETVRPQHIQQALPGDVALIEYFVGGNDLYVFALTSTDIKIEKLALSLQFFQAFEKFKSEIYTVEDGRPYRGHEASHTLYQYLIQPIIGHIADKKRWTIIPDGMLNYIPFDALVADMKENHFLLYDHIVSYAFSGKLLSFASENKRTGSDVAVLSMAPFYSPAKTFHKFGSLKASGGEIEVLQGAQFFNESATKQTFLDQSSAFDIIHLATHAETFNDNPLHSYIAFFPAEQDESAHKLYMPEIYNLDLHRVNLVVLSACEVGSGKLMTGEGTMSLSRAFAFAGCQSIVTSLWKAEDHASASIMMNMHRYLQQGYGKDEALHKAKIDYLSADAGHHLKSPVYWANFICMGNVDPMYDKASSIYLLMSVIAAAGAGCLILLNRLRNKRKFNAHVGKKIAV